MQFLFQAHQKKKFKEYFKNVSIENIQYHTLPVQGSPELYFKSINQFSKSDILPENKIAEKLNFTITSANEDNLETPTLYNNLANPITLSYISENIKSDYTITDTSLPITYDGSLLKRCAVPLSDIACNFSFDIKIVNHLDEEYKCTVYIDIPLEGEQKSILDGNIIVKKDTNYTFYRYK